MHHCSLLSGYANHVLYLTLVLAGKTVFPVHWVTFMERHVNFGYLYIAITYISMFSFNADARQVMYVCGMTYTIKTMTRGL